MKKLVVFLSLFFVALFICMLFIKKIYIIDNEEINIEIYSDKNVLQEKSNVKAKYCSILLGLFCKNIDDIEIINNNDFNALGDFEIQYKVDYKNKHVDYKKIIHVVDTQAPVITLKKAESFCPNNFVEPGYDVTDNYDTNLKDKVSTSQTGDIIYYTVTDSNNNSTTVKRELKYGDTTPPTITFKGYETEYILINTTYNDPGINIEDNCDTDFIINKDSNLDTTKTGTYYIKYTVTDKSNNSSSLTRTVKVYNKQNNVTIIPTNKVVYLTYDDGPGPYTNKLLDILKKYNVKVTFFVTNQFSGYQNVIKRMGEEGHTVAVHTYSHSYKNVYSSIDNYFNDFDKMNNIIYNQTGKKSTLFRFPGGSSNTISGFNKGIMTILSKESSIRGYKYFDWNVDSNDAGTSNATKIYNNIISGMKSHNYSVVLQHDIKSYSVNIVEDVIKFGLANGYTFLPLNETSPTAHHGINN